VQEDGLRETNGFARQALDSGAQREMFAVNLLRVDFAYGVSSRWKVTVVDSGRIGIKVLQPKRLQQLLQLDKDPIRSTAERIRQDSPTQMINRMPQPALVCFALHQTPHFIHFCGLHSAHFDYHRIWTTPLNHACVYLREAGRFFLIP
jgi:hypothetical protein